MSVPTQVTPQQKCACEDCECVIGLDSGVVKDGRNYCCQRCADGEGCQNPNCGCNQG